MLHIPPHPCKLDNFHRVNPQIYVLRPVVTFLEFVVVLPAQISVLLSVSYFRLLLLKSSLTRALPDRNYTANR